MDTNRDLLAWRFGPIVRHALSLSGRPRPRLCFVGTASADSAIGRAAFYGACSGELVDPSHLQLYPMPNVEDPAAHLLSQDVIWVSGGSVVNLLAVWRAHGIDRVMRQAWERGIVLGGVSAGSICWFAGGTTDSFGLDLRPVTDGLGFLPYSNGVHHDTEEARRPLLHRLISDETLPDGFATDDGVALHFRDQDLVAAVAATAGKYAYRIERHEGGKVVDPSPASRGRVVVGYRRTCARTSTTSRTGTPGAP
jgi:peptidase E